MRQLFSLLFTAVSFFCLMPVSGGVTVPQYDYDFNQDRMIVDRGEIFLISSFDKQDGLTVYNFNGQRLWEARFHAKILSWDVQPDIILVFSKDRDGHATYLTCIDRFNGRCLWQRP
jgi:hypothetical protein